MKRSKKGGKFIPKRRGYELIGRDCLWCKSPYVMMHTADKNLWCWYCGAVYDKDDTNTILGSD